MKFVYLLFKGKLQRIIFKVFRITFFFWVCALCETCHLGKKLALFSKFLISSFIHNDVSSGWEGAFYLFRLKSSFKNCKVNPLWWWWVSPSVVSDSCDPMDCSPPGSSVHGILQARVLEWGAVSSSRRSSRSRGRTCVSCIAGRFFPLGSPLCPHAYSVSRLLVWNIWVYDELHLWLLTHLLQKHIWCIMSQSAFSAHWMQNRSLWTGLLKHYHHQNP